MPRPPSTYIASSPLWPRASRMVAWPGGSSQRATSNDASRQAVRISKNPPPVSRSTLRPSPARMMPDRFDQSLRRSNGVVSSAAATPRSDSSDGSIRPRSTWLSRLTEMPACVATSASVASLSCRRRRIVAPRRLRSPECRSSAIDAPSAYGQCSRLRPDWAVRIHRSAQWCEPASVIARSRVGRRCPTARSR